MSETTVKERPIVLDALMVKELMNDYGPKIQHRQAFVTQPHDCITSFIPWLIDGEQEFREDGTPLWLGLTDKGEDGDTYEYGCPFGVVGEQLWVAEKFGIVRDEHGFGICYDCDGHTARYWPNYDKGKVADIDAFAVKHANKEDLPAEQMPRWASRFLLEIVSIRAEKVQDISEADAIAEGFLSTCSSDARDDFREYWDSVHEEDSGVEYKDNPTVWVVEFRNITPTK